MIGITNWEQRKARYREYWAMQNERPLYRICGIKERLPAVAEVSLETEWMDNDYQIKQARRGMNNRIYGGVSFPLLTADYGPDILGAVLGDDIEFGRDTSWAKHLFSKRDFSQIQLAFNEDNRWWQLIECRLRDFIEDSCGDYLVGFSDWHNSCDALVSLFGPEEVSLALYDCPQEVKRLNNQVADVFQIVLKKSYEIVKNRQDGTTHWMGLWNDKLWYTTSCDFNILLSPQMFEEFVIPPLEKDLNFLQSSIYHLDGPGAFRHLDRLLEIPNLHGIQLVYGSGAPPALHWIPECKRIQQAGKGIHICCLSSEVDTLLSELKPEGLFLDIQPDWDRGEGPFFQDAIDFFTHKIDG